MTKSNVFFKLNKNWLCKYFLEKDEILQFQKEKKFSSDSLIFKFGKNSLMPWMVLILLQIATKMSVWKSETKAGKKIVLLI